MCFEKISFEYAHQRKKIYTSFLLTALQPVELADIQRSLYCSRNNLNIYIYIYTLLEIELPQLLAPIVIHSNHKT